MVTVMPSVTAAFIVFACALDASYESGDGVTAVYFGVPDGYVADGRILVAAPESYHAADTV